MCDEQPWTNPGFYVIHGLPQRKSESILRQILHSVTVAQAQPSQEKKIAQKTIKNHWKQCFGAEIDLKTLLLQPISTEITDFVLDINQFGNDKIRRLVANARFYNVRVFMISNSQKRFGMADGQFYGHDKLILFSPTGCPGLETPFKIKRHFLVSIQDLEKHTTMIKSVTLLLPELVQVIQSYIETVPYCSECTASL
jgi:hypothetical protein